MGAFSQYYVGIYRNVAGRKSGGFCQNVEVDRLASTKFRAAGVAEDRVLLHGGNLKKKHFLWVPCVLIQD